MKGRSLGFIKECPQSSGWDKNKSAAPNAAHLLVQRLDNKYNTRMDIRNVRKYTKCRAVITERDGSNNLIIVDEPSATMKYACP